MLRLRDKAGFLVVVALVAFSIYGAMRYYPPAQSFKKLTRPGSLQTDPEARYLRQLSCIRQELDPAEAVGFFTSFKDDDYDRFYRLTQFGLVPVVVDDSPRHRLVVGYFPGSGEWQKPEHGMGLVKECPGGLLLLQNGAAQ